MRNLIVDDSIAALATRNIALGKRSRFCNMQDLSDKLTDGNINSTEEIITKCGSNAFVDIDLGSNYYILYVLIYDGPGYKDSVFSKSPTFSPTYF